MATATKQPTALEALDKLDKTAILIGRRKQAIHEEIRTVGHRGRSAGASTGQIAATLSAIAAAQAAASRLGEAADTSKLEDELKALETRAADLARELAAVSGEVVKMGPERLEILRKHHDEFAEIARDVADEGDELWRALATAAKAVEAHRRRAQEAIALAIAGHPGGQKGATRFAEQDRVELHRSFAPWVGSKPTTNALWEAVARVSSGAPTEA
jgi:hypothetical protein